MTIKTSEATLVTTPEHPFAKRGSGWTPAIQLAVGDQLERRDSEGATILSIEVRDVPPTPVYNLTVAKTHSYFVSSQDLLVHNDDCGPRRPSPDELRRQKRNAKPRRPAGRRPTLRELLLREKWAERRDGTLNDTPGRGNCGVCSIAGLSDADKITIFLREHGKGLSVHQDGMPKGAARRHLKELGLVGRTTPKQRIFPPSKTARKVEKSTNESEVPNFPNWPDVTKFMQDSTSNTFLVEFSYWYDSGDRGHTVLAVRDADGSIQYVDLQTNPPRIMDPSVARVYRVDVIPTDVDWRFNRQINRVVTGGQ